MNDTHTILISNKALPSKPKGREIASWQIPCNYVQMQMDVAEFAGRVGKGHCWRAAVYKEGFSSFRKSDAIGSNVVALDFDACDTNPFEVVRFAASIAPEPNIIYPTYSQNPKTWDECIAQENCQPIQCIYKYINKSNGPINKSLFKNGYNFRMIWCLDSMLSVSDYEYCVSSLQTMLQQYCPDESTKDASRLWFGGNLGSLIFSEHLCDTDRLKASIATANLSANVVKSGSLRNGKRRKNNYKDYLSSMPEQDRVVVSGKWWEKLNGVCPLWNKFASGQYLSYNERLVLFTNLKYLRHSDKTSVKDDVQQFIDWDTWMGHTFDEQQLTDIFSERTLKPLKIVRDTNGWVTVADYMKVSKLRPVYPFDIDMRISLEQLDSWMDENVPLFLSSDGVSYFVSQTASGKTERIIRYIHEQLRKGHKIIYAAPHYLGIAEFAERFEAYANGFCHVAPQQTLSRKDSMLLQLGLPKETHCPERSNFLREMNDSASGLWVITHQLLSNLTSVNADLIIVDENIEESLIRTDIITQNQLGSITPYLGEISRKKVLDFCDLIQSAGRGKKVDVDFLEIVSCRNSEKV